MFFKTKQKKISLRTKTHDQCKRLNYFPALLEYYPISVKSRYRLLVFDLPIKPFLAKSNSNNRKSNKEPLQLVIQAFICITAGQKI